ncbi:MAG: nitroreductase family protein [Muribaculaceae bacterium]|nr:nitroreductase family protein [Muribaculaceae bacterium]
MSAKTYPEGEYLLTRGRYSCRTYTDEVPSAELIRKVLDGAHYAPSACNRQPWRMMLIGPDDASARKAVIDSYSRPWIAAAPYFVIVCAVDDEAWVRPADGKNHADVDVSILAEHLCLEATVNGLGTCWVCNFDPAVLAAGINFPAGVRPVVIVPVGFPAGEAPAKTRKALDDILLHP